MKKIILILIIIAVVALGAYLFFAPNLSDPSAVYRTYQNSELGLEFNYPPSYVLQEVASTNATGELIKTIVLMPAEDVGQAPEGGEGAPTITIQVLKNTNKEQPGNWANNHNIYSNINLKLGEVSEAVVGGANAVRYRVDGLYVSNNAVVAHGGYIYVISGMFLDQSSPTFIDFEPVLNSVRFIPAPGQQ